MIPLNEDSQGIGINCVSMCEFICEGALLANFSVSFI